jgi:hypothetical protein
MIRLSRLELMNESEMTAPSRCVGGREIRPELEDFARMEGRFLGAVGALVGQLMRGKELDWDTMIAVLEPGRANSKDRNTSLVRVGCGLCRGCCLQ